MSTYIIGHSLTDLRAERKQLQKEFPKLTEVQLRVYMVSKYGISHDSTGHIVPVSLDEVFVDDPSDQFSSSD